jgi:putative flippase GtrA
MSGVAPNDSKLRRTGLQFVRFVISGGLSAVVDLGTLRALLTLEIPRVGATSLAFLTGAFVNYLLHRHFTFQARHASSAGELFRFACVIAFNMVLTTGLVEALTRGLSLDVMVSKVLTLPVIAGSGFLLSRAFVFTPREPS